MTTIGERFAHFMDQNKLSREEINLATGIDVTNVSKIVQNKLSITRKNQDKIATGFPQLSIDWLIYGRGTMYVQEQIPPIILDLLKSVVDLAAVENVKLEATNYLKKMAHK